MNPENKFLALLSSCLWTDILWGNFNPLLYEQIECRKERFTLFPLFTSGTHRLRPCSLLTSANWVNMLKRLTVGYESKFKTWNHSFHGSEQVSRFTESVLLQDRSNKKSTFSVILFCAVAARDHTSLFSFLSEYVLVEAFRGWIVLLSSQLPTAYMDVNKCGLWSGECPRTSLCGYTN